MRKVLSFVLVLALVLSSFSMAFAADTTAGLSDVADSASKQAIEVCNNLGIVTGNPDGTFLPEKAVNRAEFAAMITRALGIPDSALAGYTTSKFKDTSGYGWAVKYLAFCESKGIMLGDGAGNAMPGRTINTNEAVTMILRAVGYTANSAELIGIWPANYVSLAQDKGLYDDTAAATSVDKANAAQMIYNGLTIQKVQVASDGQTTALTKKVGGNDVELSMLNTGLNCYIGDNADYKADVVEYNADALINVLPYVGDLAYVYYNSDDKIIAIGDIDSTPLTGKFTAPDEFEADDVTYNVSSGAVGVKFNNAAIDNGLSIKTDESETYTINVKVNNKTIKDAEFYSLERWDVTAGEKVEAGDLDELKNGKLLGIDFSTDKGDVIIDKSFELIGVKSLKDIKADHVVYVYADAASNSNDIRRVAVGTEVVEGKVTKVSDTDKEWTINSKVYAFSGEGDEYKNELGNEVKAWLDAYGDIHEYEAISGTAKDYAVVQAVDTAGFDRVKLYLADDSTKTFSTDIKTTLTAETLIGYGLDKDGVIDGVYTSTNIEPTVATLTGIKVLEATVSGATKAYKVSSDVVVFTAEGKDYTKDITDVAKIADVDKDENLVTVKAGFQFLMRDGEIVAMIVDDSLVGGSGNDVYAAVGSLSEEYVNDHKAQGITGFVGGKEAKGDVYTSGLNVIDSADVADPSKILKVNYNSDNEISRVEAKTAVVNGEVVTEKGSSKNSYIMADELYAIASDAVFYEAKYKTDKTTFDKYASFSGTIYAESKVYLFETDKDSAGYDVVIIDTTRADSAYKAPTIKLTSGSSSYTFTTSGGIGVATSASINVSAVVDGVTTTAGIGVASDATGVATVSTATTLDGGSVTITAGSSTGSAIVTLTTPADKVGNTETLQITITVR